MNATRKTVLQSCVLALALAGGLTQPHEATAHSEHAQRAVTARADHASHDVNAHAEHAVKPEHAGHASATSPADHANHANHADHAKHAAAGKNAEGVNVRFADVALLDQDSRERRLKSDVIGDRIVVMDFVYTSCTTVCPVVSAIMSEVQSKLGARVGRDVALVSMTVDPVRDTPARLRDYARSRGAGPGWSWLTGSTTAINDTLKGLGTWTPDFEDHPVVMMVGDGRSGQWTRFYGFADPAALVAQVESLTAARGATAKE
ncbi:SCO family protein [Aromatoleum diolicum]|uniref:SCO family protein n=1 Tax=Aromatoleum diolicum TaxID=75796 RepID=A0ABX1QB94_9RHOO|nr:SCO family protein [Aromatoleum diolicum]NMG75652.1 SCO family protein [Aromatoleum diolicum]